MIANMRPEWPNLRAAYDRVVVATGCRAADAWRIHEAIYAHPNGCEGWSIEQLRRAIVEALAADYRRELEAIADVVADCADLEEPVPARVKRRRAELERVLAYVEGCS